MKLRGIVLLAAVASAFLISSAEAWQLQVVYGFELGPANPNAGLVQGGDGNFYGTTGSGGTDGNNGTVFKVTTNGVLTTLVSFGDPTNGVNPNAGLVQGPDGDFYGTTAGGGSGGNGTVFKVTTNGVLTRLVSFTGLDGRYPQAALVLGSDGNFYGTTDYGGSGSDLGTVFRMTPGGTLTRLVSFTGDNGAYPQSGLVLGSDGNFYGTTANGGSDYVVSQAAGHGTVFKVTTNGVLTSLVSFTGDNGAYPRAGLVLGSDGSFYGTTDSGGSSYVDIGQQGYGTVFQVRSNGVLTTLFSFDQDANGNFTNGYSPTAGLVSGNDGDFYGTTSSGGGTNGLGTVFRVTSNGLLTTLASFNGVNGSHPNGLVLGSDGNLYGTTWGSGSFGDKGKVFQVTTNGVLTVLASFTDVHGSYPYTELMLGGDGNYYGTTTGGGSNNVGTVFRVTASGAFTTLASFTGANCGNPWAGLALGNDGNLYGTTYGGGFFGGPSCQGSVFRVTTNGLLTTLFLFTPDVDGNYTNGSNPNAGLVLGTDGNFYGTTSSGGSDGFGTVFQVTTNGAFISLVSFTGDNGSNPRAVLALGTDGNFYGTTAYGGSTYLDPRYSAGLGTVFQVTPDGVLTTLVSFTDLDGRYPQAGLVSGSDGNFYGTTSSGGRNGDGTVFKVTTNGVLTTLVSFNGNNGSGPTAGLVPGPDGNFYGTTFNGGRDGAGTVFKVTTNGVLTRLVSFTLDANGDYPNGSNPQAGLVLGNDASFYGTAAYSGPGGGGTIFRLVNNVSQPRFTNLAVSPGGSLSLSGTGPANEAYRLRAGASLASPFTSWTLLTGGSFDSSGHFAYTDAGAATNTTRFYQISVP